VAMLTLYKNCCVPMAICLFVSLFIHDGSITKTNYYCYRNTVITIETYKSILVGQYNGMLLPKFPKFYTTVQYVTSFTLALVRVQSHMNLFSFLPCHFFRAHFNVILHCTNMSRSSKRSLSLKFAYQSSVCRFVLSHNCHMLLTCRHS